jgi:HSP20 family protein
MATNMTYNPYRALSELQQQMEQLWQQSAHRSNQESANWMPAVDIYETDNELVLLGELPGMAESDFKVSVENSVLTLSGTRKLAAEKKLHRQERPAGNFQRSFTLPANFDQGKISAAYNNGVLQIKLPKKAEAKPRQITVKVK